MDYRAKSIVKQPESGVLYIDEAWFFFRKQKGATEKCQSNKQYCCKQKYQGT